VGKKRRIYVYALIEVKQCMHRKITWLITDSTVPSAQYANSLVNMEKTNEF